MSGGLVGLLDDVAALAKLAAASIDDVGAAAGRASVKAAGVVVDDTAVTPAYVHGLAAERELPIIKRIAKGSLKNKILFILPAALRAQRVRAGARRDHPDVRRHLPVLRGRREDPPPLRPPRRTTPIELPAAAIDADHEETDDRGRDPHRLHPVGRDHGDRAQGGHRRGLRVAGRSSSSSSPC